MDANGWGGLNPTSGTELWDRSGAGSGGNTGLDAWGGGNSRKVSQSPAMWGKSGASEAGKPSGWDGERKDGATAAVTGWGSLNPSPAPNVGTEAWGASSKPDNRGASPWDHHAGGDWGGNAAPAATGGAWGGEKPTSNGYPEQEGGAWGDGGGDRTSGGAAQGAWSRGNPISSNHISSVSNVLAQSTPLQSSTTSSTSLPLVSASTSAPASSTSWAQAAGRGIPSTSATTTKGTTAADAAATARALQEEMIARAINSSEGWGKTPIRQDTAWVVDEPTQRTPEIVPIAPESIPQQANPNSVNGTSIWETSKVPETGGAVGGVVGPSPGGSAWSGTPVEKTPDIAALLNPASAGALPASSFRNPTNSWPTSTADRPSSWAGGGPVTTGDGLWGAEKKEGGDDASTMWGQQQQPQQDGRTSRAESTAGGWGDKPLHRSLSSSSWSGSDSGMEPRSAGWGDGKARTDVDDGTACWGDPSGGAPGLWRDEKSGASQAPPGLSGVRPGSESGFSGPPPSVGDLKSGVFGGGEGDGMPGAWHPSSGQQPKLNTGGSWNETSWPPGGPAVPATLQSRFKTPPTPGAWTDTSAADWSIRKTMSAGNFGPGGVGAGARGGLGGGLSQPQSKVMIQQLIDLGFKKEDVQNALFSNNMDIHSALVSLQQRSGGDSTDLENSALNDLHKTVAPFLRSVSNQEDGGGNLSHLTQLLGAAHDPTSGPNANLFSGLGNVPGAGPLPMLNNQFPGNASASLQQLQASLPSQLLQQQQQQLQQLANAASLNSNTSAAAASFSSINPQLQKLLQQSSSALPLGSGGALTSPGAGGRGGLGGAALPPPMPPPPLATVQDALRLGILPAQLISPQILTNTQFLLNLQQLVQMYQLHSLISAQVQAGTATQSVIETKTNLQQHINTQKNLLLQMAASAVAAGAGGRPTMPPPLGPLPPLGVPPPPLQTTPVSSQVDQLLRTLANMTTGGEESTPGVSRLTSWTSADNPESSKHGENPPGDGRSWGNTGGIGDPGNSMGDKNNASGSSFQTSKSGEDGGAESVATTLEIEEFVPGKLWQGPNMKNIDDDPYITPGSVGMSSGDSKTSGALGLGGKTGSSSSLWAGGEAGADQWGARGPGGGGMNWNQQQNINRSVSWTPGEHSMGGGVGGWNQGNNAQVGSQSAWIVLKNISRQVDPATLSALCQQHGHINKFIPSERGHVLVGYSRAEDAAKAQQALNMCHLGGSQIIADVVGGDLEAAQYLPQDQARGGMGRPGAGPLQPPNYMPGNMMPRSPAPPGGDWRGGSWGGAGNVWGGMSMENSPFLPNDLLGGQ